MDSDISRDFHKELTCLICLDYLTDPVTMGCGHSYCRPCLSAPWEEAENPVCCPLCKETSQQASLKTNILLQNLVSIARKASLRQVLSSGEHMCVLHKEATQMFCEDERSLLCVHCASSQGHQAHRHLSVEQAAQESRAKLSMQMRSLRQNIQNLQENLRKDGRISAYFDDCLLEHQIEDFFKNLQVVLREEEEYYFEKIMEEGSEMCEQLEKRETEMFKKSRRLIEMHEELKEICHKPDIVMLQELGDKLTRSEQLQLHIPQPLRPELPARPIAGLMDRLNQYRVEISFTNEITNHSMRLFDDVRSLRFFDDRVHVTLDPGTSEYFAAWGTQVFTSGKHYWEVHVDDSWDWAVGVCRESWKTNNGTLTESLKTFLLVCVKEDNQYTLWATGPMMSQYVAKPVGKVGVFLDVDGGRVSFVDVEKCSLIKSVHTIYQDDTFHFPFIPFIYTGHK